MLTQERRASATAVILIHLSAAPQAHERAIHLHLDIRHVRHRTTKPTIGPHDRVRLEHLDVRVGYAKLRGEVLLRVLDDRLERWIDRYWGRAGVYRWLALDRIHRVNRQHRRGRRWLATRRLRAAQQRQAQNAPNGYQPSSHVIN
jgi:hypothetical protein